MFSAATGFSIAGVDELAVSPQRTKRLWPYVERRDLHSDVYNTAQSRPMFCHALVWDGRGGGYKRGPASELHASFNRTRDFDKVTDLHHYYYYAYF